MGKNLKVAMYLRISSLANADSDSLDRQTLAIATYANNNKMDIVVKKSDIGVRGDINIFEREGFKEIYDYCLNEDIKHILVENSSRFSRDLIQGELGYMELKKYGIQIVPVDSPDYYVLENDDPMIKLIRQQMGCFAEFEKNSIVRKLRGARKRKKDREGKCEGRKSYEEIYTKPRYERLLKKVSKLCKQGLSYAEVSKALADKGWVQPTKLKPFHRMQIRKFKLLGDKL